MTHRFHRLGFFFPIGFEAHSSQKGIFYYSVSLFFVWILCAVLLAPFEVFAEGSVKTLKFGFGSCLSKPDPVLIRSVVDEELDHFFILGDAIYYEDADFKSSESMSAAFKSRMNSNGLAQLLQKIPVKAIWDDHDFGPQDADASFPLAQEAEEIFRSQMPIGKRPDGFKRGIHQEFFLKDALFIMTDNRSFRQNPDKETPTMFGEKQLTWMTKLLTGKKGRIHFLVSGNQFAAANEHYEHARQYPRDFEILRHALQSATVPTVILSGDKHFAEILLWEAGGNWPVLEITSSPLSSELAPKSNAGEEAMRQGMLLGHHNYAVVTVRYLPKVVSLKAEIKDRNGKTRLTHAMVFKE